MTSYAHNLIYYNRIRQKKQEGAAGFLKKLLRIVRDG